jgi:hypothetical protein
MAFLVLEDCIRLLWPGSGEVTGWEGEEQQPKPAKRKRDTPSAPAPVRESEAAASTAPKEKKTRAPQKCTKCGQIRKGHTCPFATPQTTAV